MFITQLLKRKDAVAIIVAVVLGLMLGQFVSSLALTISSFMAEVINQAPRPGAQPFEWRTGLFDPTIIFLLQFVVLELTLQVAVRGRRLLRHSVAQVKKS